MYFDDAYIYCNMTHADSTVVFSERELTLYAIARPSVCRLSVICRLSVVCNVRAPYSGGSNFRQYFYGIGTLAIR